MDNNLHNIDEIFAKALADHRIEPPPHVWDNIKGQLDATSGEYIDDVFSKALGAHTMTPPAYVWDNIKAKLDAESGKRKVRMGWIIGTASAVILAFVGGYFIANYTGMGTDNEHVSEKITNTHQNQIDVNAFWDLRKITPFGESHSGGQTFTNTTPYNGTDVYDGVNNENGNTPEDNRTVPNSVSGEHGPIVPSKNQSGGDDNGKKTEAVTSDVNGRVESQIGAKGSTTVTALNNNNHVIVENSTNENTVNNTLTKETHTDEGNVYPNDQSTFENKKNINLANIESEPTFTILPYFSPTITWRNSSMANTNGIQNAFDTTNANSKFSEKMNFSYSTGVLVGYNFTPKLTVFIGASFNSFSNTTSREDIHTRSFDQIPSGDTSTHILTTAGELDGVNVIPTSTGSAEDPTYMLQDNTIGKVKSITQTFSYVEVPVLVRYKIGGPKVGLILTGGISTGFMVQNDVTLTGADETRNFGSTSQIRNFNMNAHFGIGIEARILPFMFLNVEPTFKYSFLNWSMDSRFQMNPISLGLNTGLAFKF
jgi:hypothetical protein